MIETEMQRVADYEEFIVHAQQHHVYVSETRGMADEAEKVITRIQEYLMGRESYAEHDFHATSKLIENSKKNTLKQLNYCYVDFYRNISRLDCRWQDLTCERQALQSFLFIWVYWAHGTGNPRARISSSISS